MTDHTAARTVLVIVVLGIVAILGIYCFEFLDPMAAIALSVTVLFGSLYFAHRIWRVYR